MSQSISNFSKHLDKSHLLGAKQLISTDQLKLGDSVRRVHWQPGCNFSKIKISRMRANQRNDEDFLKSMNLNYKCPI